MQRCPLVTLTSLLRGAQMLLLPRSRFLSYIAQHRPQGLPPKAHPHRASTALSPPDLLDHHPFPPASARWPTTCSLALVSQRGGGAHRGVFRVSPLVPKLQVPHALPHSSIQVRKVEQKLVLLGRESAQHTDVPNRLTLLQSCGVHRDNT